MQEVRNDGSVGPIEEFDFDSLEKKIGDPNVKEVRVFRLKKGMNVMIGGHEYKVTTVREDGKAVLRPKTNSA